MNFEFYPQSIQDVILVKPRVFTDERGFFMESYKKSDFVKNGIVNDFVQDNYSKSTVHVLRGLHFQEEPYSQAKLVRCIRGKIYDIAVDLRPESPTFKKYIKVELSDTNNHQLFIPKRFAHGFVVLSEEAEVCYKTDCEYNSTADKGVFWADEDLNIDWGIDFTPIISTKDKMLPKLKEIKL